MINLYINSQPKYQLLRFNVNEFNSDSKLHIISDDIKGIKEAFENFESFSVHKNDKQVLYSESYDCITEIGYKPSVYNDETKTYNDVIVITLGKKSFVDQLNAIEKQLNKVVDVDAMSLTETKEYIKEMINTQCQKDIENGISIITSYGPETFKLTDYAQRNIGNLFQTVAADNEGIIPGLAYHSENNLCRFYPREDIINIYASMEMKITQNTTHANFLKKYVEELADKEDVLACSLETQLPEVYATQESEILGKSQYIVQQIMNKLLNIEGDIDEEDSES